MDNKILIKSNNDLYKNISNFPNLRIDNIGIIKSCYLKEPLKNLMLAVHRLELPVFCNVMKSSMQKDIRNFISASWKTIQKYYSYILDDLERGIEQSELTIMEVIKENHPCRFYIDTESKFYDSNSNQNWEITLDNIINFIKYSLVEYFDLEAQHKIEYFIMDSTSREKFSKHIIFYVLDENSDTKKDLKNELLFENNVCFKNFLKTSLFNFHEFLNKKLIDQDEINKEEFTLFDRHNAMYIFKDQGYGLQYLLKIGSRDDEHVIDSSVYTKNRNFRIFLSTKLGQKRPLIPEYCSIAEYGKPIDLIRSFFPNDERNPLIRDDLSPFFCDWKPYNRARVLKSFNKDFIFKIGPICLFDGWKDCPIIKAPSEKYKNS